MRSVNVRIKGGNADSESGSFDERQTGAGHGTDTCKSWGVVTFNEEAPVQLALDPKQQARAGVPSSWLVRSMEPEKLQSIQTTFLKHVSNVPHAQSRGRALWFFMRSRLRELINIQKVWGNVHSMYESRDSSIYEAMPLPRCIRDPDSVQSMCWDLLQVLLLLYLAVTLPLRVCLGLDVTPDEAMFWVDVFADCFFAIDLCLNFRTAYIDENGVREERPCKIFLHYLRGWFLFGAPSNCLCLVLCVAA
eukprot:SAG11_NODE_494_length_8948_cov_2.882699_8_plen_248_part_00